MSALLFALLMIDALPSAQVQTGVRATPRPAFTSEVSAGALLFGDSVFVRPNAVAMLDDPLRPLWAGGVGVDFGGIVGPITLEYRPRIVGGTRLGRPTLTLRHGAWVGVAYIVAVGVDHEVERVPTRAPRHAAVVSARLDVGVLIGAIIRFTAST
jgi:hypothetical protein